MTSRARTWRAPCDTVGCARCGIFHRAETATVGLAVSLAWDAGAIGGTCAWFQTLASGALCDCVLVTVQGIWSRGLKFSLPTKRARAVSPDGARCELFSMSTRCNCMVHTRARVCTKNGRFELPRRARYAAAVSLDVPDHECFAGWASDMALRYVLTS